MQISRLVLALGLFAAACSDLPTADSRSAGEAPRRNSTGTLARVEITPSSVDLFQEQSVTLSAMAYDDNNNPMPWVPITWGINDGTIANINSSGVVTAFSNGTTTASAWATWNGVTKFTGSFVNVIGRYYAENRHFQCYYLQNDVVWVDEDVYSRYVTEYANGNLVYGAPFLSTRHTYDVGPYSGGSLPCETYDGTNW